MSLQGVYDDQNVFAKILRGEIPNHTVYEDDQVLSFMDAFPQSRGHTLIIPKTPSRNILEADASDLTPLIEITQKVAKAVNTVVKPDGIIVTQFNGAPAGQSVFHLHFHVIPRYDGEGLGGHGAGQADPGELAVLAKQIGAAL